MKKMLNSWKNLARKFGFSATQGKNPNPQRKFTNSSLSFEALESRQLLSITLHWVGNGIPNTDQIWDTTSANWTTDGFNRVTFSNSIEYDVKFDRNNSPRSVQIACDVQPASVSGHQHHPGFGWRCVVLGCSLGQGRWGVFKSHFGRIKGSGVFYAKVPPGRDLRVGMLRAASRLALAG